MFLVKFLSLCIFVYSQTDLVIYDLGMNNGGDSIAYLKMGYKVIAIEANPIFSNLSNSIPELMLAKKNGRFVCENVGLWPNENGVHKVINFYIHKVVDEWSSFIRELGCREDDRQQAVNDNYCSILQVPTIGLQEIINKHGTPYYMKIDIEGADAYCLHSLRNLTVRPKYVSAEFHNYRSEFKLLKAAGYNRFKIVDQSKFRRARSGAFGEFALDIKYGMDWRHLGQMRRFFESSPKGSRSWKENGEILKYCPEVKKCWFDFHATKI